MRTVTIRGEPHTVLQAMNRQIAHYAQHTGQIIFLAKHLRSSEWKTLSIPRGKSENYKTGCAEIRPRIAAGTLMQRRKHIRHSRRC